MPVTAVKLEASLTYGVVAVNVVACDDYSPFPPPPLPHDHSDSDNVNSELLRLMLDPARGVDSKLSICVKNSFEQRFRRFDLLAWVVDYGLSLGARLCMTNQAASLCKPRLELTTSVSTNCLLLLGLWSEKCGNGEAPRSCWAYLSHRYAQGDISEKTCLAH